MVRAVLELADYPIRIYHVPGKANGRADAHYLEDQTMTKERKTIQTWLSS
jgi:hypothetical protein